MGVFQSTPPTLLHQVVAVDYCAQLVDAGMQYQRHGHVQLDGKRLSLPQFSNRTDNVVFKQVNIYNTLM